MRFVEPGLAGGDVPGVSKKGNGSDELLAVYRERDEQEFERTRDAEDPAEAVARGRAMVGGSRLWIFMAAKSVRRERARRRRRRGGGYGGGKEEERVKRVTNEISRIFTVRGNHVSSKHRSFAAAP